MEVGTSSKCVKWSPAAIFDRLWAKFQSRSFLGLGACEKLIIFQSHYVEMTCERIHHFNKSIQVDVTLQVNKRDESDDTNYNLQFKPEKIMLDYYRGLIFKDWYWNDIGMNQCEKKDTDLVGFEPSTSMYLLNSQKETLCKTMIR